ncbi:MAG: sugar phosphate isomerase/epimerase family protein [Armatimonadota bacterium]
MKLADQLAASSVTFRDEPLEKALDRLQMLGFTRIDLTAIRHYSDHFDPLLVDVGEEECFRVRDIITAHGMTAVSVVTYPANPLAIDINGDDWASGIDAYVRLGQVLGSTVLILPPGSPAPHVDRWRGTAERVLPWLRDGVRRISNAHMRPSIALQSNSLLRTSRQGIDLLKILGMPQAGLAIDPAHLSAMGEDPVQAIRRMGAAINFVVLRDAAGRNFNLPPGRGKLDYPGILTALDEIAYAGPLVLAIDNVAVKAEERTDLLKRGWDYLLRISERKAA